MKKKHNLSLFTRKPKRVPFLYVNGQMIDERAPVSREDIQNYLRPPIDPRMSVDMITASLWADWHFKTYGPHK